jgi:hypothetical protein
MGNEVSTMDQEQGNNSSGAKKPRRPKRKFTPEQVAESVADPDHRSQDPEMSYRWAQCFSIPSEADQCLPQTFFLRSGCILGATALALAAGCFTPKCDAGAGGCPLDAGNGPADAAVLPADASQPVLCATGQLMTEDGKCVDRACNSTGWCWEFPLPIGGSYSIHGSSPANVWAVGSVALLEYDGNNWIYHPSLGEAYALVPWVFSPTDVWVGFSDGIRHWNGHAWDIHQLSDPVLYLWASAPDDLWAITENYPQRAQASFHWDGQGFAQVALPPNIYVNHISGTGSQDVWFGGNSSPVGNSAVISHWDGSTWQESYRKQTADPLGLSALLAIGGSDAWAAFENTLLHFDGATWSEIAFPGKYPTGFYVSHGDIVVQTSEGDFQQTGDTWQALDTTNRAPDNVWPAVDPIFGGTGSRGGIWKLDSGSWARILPTKTLVDFDFYLVWRSGEQIYATGQADNANDVVHWDGSSWSLLPRPPGALASWTALTGTGPNDVFAIDYSSSDLFHYDGQSWTSAPMPGLSSETASIWGAGPGDVWVANMSGNAGDLWHGDGTSWPQHYSEPLGCGLPAIFGGTSGSDVWVSEDQLYHWDGSAWNAAPTPNCLTSIAAASPTLALATFSDSTFTTSAVSKWDGHAWKTEPTFDQGQPGFHVCTNGTEFWVAPGYHRDASGTWSSSFAPFWVGGPCAVSPDGTVRFFGSYGSIVKHAP